MTRIFRFVTAIGCSLPGLAYSAETIHPKPSELLAEIHKSSARAVIGNYENTRTWTDVVLPGIASADSRWLLVDEALYTGADAGAAEDLESSTYAALGVAPLRVAPLIARLKKLTLREVCNVSFDAEVPPGGALPYLAKIRKGLRAAKTPGESMIAKECSLGLDAALNATKSQGIH